MRTSGRTDSKRTSAFKKAGRRAPAAARMIWHMCSGSITSAFRAGSSEAPCSREMRALYTQTTIGGVGEINQANGFTGNQSVGQYLWGGYVEAAYNILDLLAP